MWMISERRSFFCHRHLHNLDLDLYLNRGAYPIDFLVFAVHDAANDIEIPAHLREARWCLIHVVVR